MPVSLFLPNTARLFEQLYNKADIALYRSKDLGKDHITLYDERMGTDFERLKDAHNDIESLGSENFAMNMPHNIFKILCDAKDINISAKLPELICKHFGFERGYIFENLTDNEKCRQTYEWCAEEFRQTQAWTERLTTRPLSPTCANAFRKMAFISTKDGTALKICHPILTPPAATPVSP